MSITQKESLTSKFEKHPGGMKKGFTQVGATIRFEMQRNLKNMIVSFGIAIGIYLLSLVINLIQEGRGVESPETAADYMITYLTLIGLFIIIIASMFGGNMIALDYEKQTGNLLFPKITKGRLFLGRLIARYILSAIAVIAYYLLIAVTTLIKYGELPLATLTSLGWALLYMFLVLSLVIFFSSILKKTSTTIVLSILMLLMVFELTNTILMMTGVEIEPFFILTYYGNIITESFNMPSERFVQSTLRGPGQGGVDAPTIMRWITPSISGAIIGMLVYSAILLLAAYFFFRIRQQK
ncbi:MAG: ABC transporter permease [Candidatus Heimdallarchaeaceae archaeon]